jgi:hypothetical protein
MKNLYEDIFFISPKVFIILSPLPLVLWWLQNIFPIGHLFLPFLFSLPFGISFWMGIYGILLIKNSLWTKQSVNKPFFAGLVLATLISGGLGVSGMVAAGLEVIK